MSVKMTDGYKHFKAETQMYCQGYSYSFYTPFIERGSDAESTSLCFKAADT